MGESQKPDDGMDELVHDFLVESHENLDRLDQDFVALEKEPGDRARLASIFRTIHTIKGTCGFLGFERLQSLAHAGETLLGKLRDGALTLDAPITSALLELVDAVRQVLARVEKNGGEGELDYAPLRAKLAELAEAKGAAASVAAPENAPTKVVEPVAAPTAEPTSDLAHSTLRVDVGLIDELMDRVGELVLTRNQILQHDGAREDASLHAATQRLDQLTTQLQEHVTRTRLQPIGTAWSRFPRVVRDLALSLGKQARLETSGEETELDRTIVEAIKDPLTHLLRNAVDHGLEPPPLRQQRGKPVEGAVRLRAFHNNGRVVVEVTDDGGGIDPARVKQKAVEKRILTAEQAAAMSDRAAVDLVFLPGFTTAERVTNVSGRGVGMDVVKSHVAKIGGAVTIESVVGKGTTVRVEIPPTLAIVPALVVECARGCFAIPQSDLVELLRLDASSGSTAVENVHGAPVHRLRGSLLPLVALERVLARSPTRREQLDRASTHVVVLHTGEQRFGLVVDLVRDTHEIVVKPLPRLLGSLPSYAGVTILGDGRVALVLDVEGLASVAGAVAPPSEGVATDRGLDERDARGDGRGDGGAVSTFVVFRAGERRIAVPLCDVARLEAFERADVEWDGRRAVVQYGGAILPLVAASGDAGVFASARSTKLCVLVHADRERRVGLVVDDVPDVVSETVRVRDERSIVLQEQVTELVALRDLVGSGA
jgi:two-component system chemotaxis sensor kinase CheA